ncbi:uncharacterized protein LOC132562879 [Ylistrum balloti]|uniref:uncharacterized protein LOC132562879 n=1 Tax=Ylistrum balloti TaxID=509963 RepID=UPI0029059152|nr:uncharacterized protein LOC132562879 [Ylistrum balloti]
MFKNCTVSIKCSECGSDQHATALHPRDRGEPINRKEQNKPSRHNDKTPSQNGGEKSVEVGVVNKCTRVCGGKKFSGRSCSKTILVKVHPTGKPELAINMYAILDDQSNRTLCRPAFFDVMNVSGETTERYTLVSCAGDLPTQGRCAHGFSVSSLDGEFSLSLPGILECDQIPNNRLEIPTPEITTYHSHLKDVDLPPLDPGTQILLLIGRDVPEAHHVCEQIIGPSNSPFAQRLRLGWVIVGNVCLGTTHPPDSSDVSVLKTRILEDGRPTLFPPCENQFKVKGVYEESNIGRDVFQQTQNDNKVGLSLEDRAFLELMDKEFTKDSQGKWIAPLPFREPRPRLPNNRYQALKRAQILDASLQRNPVKRDHFTSFMKGIIDNGHAELAPPLSDDEECWYLPLFGIYHPKKPDKIRGVFDSSAMYEGISLNQVLMKGPDLTNNLLGVLLRFRKEAVAVSCDVEQMFYCFGVREDHRNFLRFIWYEDNDPGKQLVEYRMLKHVFGNSPSPAVASYGLLRTAKEGEREFGSNVLEFIQGNFYVDDGLTSLLTAQEAISLLDQTKKALNTSHIRLHKFTSNCEDVLNALPPEDLANDLRKIEIGTDALPSQRSLGLCWELETDVFTFAISKESKPYTRRGVLSTINRLYDPLGFLSPETVQGKILLRDMVSGTIDWDQPLPEEFKDSWKQWDTSVQDLETFQIPRRYPSHINSVSELHVYSDASERAISAVAYLKSLDEDGQPRFSFVLGKSKIAPRHGHTIPRLELCAAVLAVEIAEVITQELSFPRERIFFHTDSKVVLGYVTNRTRRFYIYVANRVCRILEFSKPDQWFYVSTESNPADIGTRYIAPALLERSMWIQGPPKPDSPEIEPSSTSSSLFPLVAPDEDVEVRQEVVKVIKTDIEDVDKPPSQNTTIVQDGTNVTLNRSVESRAAAEVFIVRELQRGFYGDIRKCPKELSPYLDENGIIRVGGRLKKSELPRGERNPILIPGRHHVATLLTRHFHYSVQHQGRHLTEGAIRSAGFWITGGKRLVSFVIHHCMKCRRLRGKCAEQKMADLPTERVTPSPPFTYVGVDVFGPWNVVTRRTRGGSAASKRWAALFTCLFSRAVHIELLEEMSSASFINAVRRFYAIRGKVAEFRSDRGTNFIGATSDLGATAIFIEDRQVKEFLRESGTIWKFNPPTDTDNPCILSPATILTQKTGSQVESFGYLGHKDMFRSQWKHVQVLAENFWNRWRKEFLPLLQTRRKWKHESPNVEEGDVVLMKDEQVARNDWPLGIITRTFPSEDGLVRKVEIQICRGGKKSTLVRPVTQIVILLSKDKEILSHVLQGFVQSDTCTEDGSVLYRNLSLNKPANQSTFFEPVRADVPIGFAWRANDGNKSSEYTKGSCSHTAIQPGNHWWQVDLQGIYNVTSVNIVNRAMNNERLRDFGIEMSMSDQDDGNGHLVGAITCHYHPGAGIGRSEERAFPCTAGTVGRHVRIYMLDNSVKTLTLCEVEVSGYKMTCDVSTKKDVTSTSSSTTTEVTSTSSPTITFPDTTNDPAICNCRCVNTTVLTVPELIERVNQLKKELTTDKKQTISYRRKLISAQDNRTSAKGIGAVLGVGGLVFIFGSILVMDLLRLKRFLLCINH